MFFPIFFKSFLTQFCTHVSGLQASLNLNQDPRGGSFITPFVNLRGLNSLNVGEWCADSTSHLD